MAVHIHEDSSGRFVIDISGEPGIQTSAGFNNLIFAFAVVDRRSDRLLLDSSDKSTEPLAYLVEGIRKLGYTVVLSDALQTQYNSYHREVTLIRELERSAQTNARPSDPETAEVLHEVLPTIDLLPHQEASLEHILAVQNAAVFSVQGSGKTAVILAAFAIWRKLGMVDKLFVIGPLSCFRPWEEEFERCFSRPPQVLRWSGSIVQRRRLVTQFHESELLLCSYDTACRDERMLADLFRHFRVFLVLDESHYIKNFDIGRRAGTVLRLSPVASLRAVLTGTPAPHSLYDIWTQFAFLWPHTLNRVLGTRQQFQNLVEYTESPSQELRRRLLPFFSRTTQSDLGLPQPRVEFALIPENSVPREQRRIVDLLEIKVAREAMKLVTSIRDRQTLREWRRARIIRLLQSASNPGLLIGERSSLIRPSMDMDLSDLLRDAARFDDGGIVSAKVSWTVEKTRELVAEGTKVVIWASWVSNVKLLSRLLSDLNPLLLYGEIKPYAETSNDEEEETRERNIIEFRTREDRPILIANPAACAEAISLHRECHNAIYLDRTFNCGQFLQSMNRIHRIGLPEGVQTVYWIPILDCAIEQSVNTRLSLRQRTMYDFLGDDAPVIDMEEESIVSDSDSELEEAFNHVITEIQSGNHDTANAGPNP